MTRKPIAILSTLILTTILLLTACSSPTPAPTAAPAEASHDCTTTASSWSQVYANFGIDYYNTKPLPAVLVNGVAVNPANYTLQPKDVVSLANGTNCNPGYIQARAQSFNGIQQSADRTLSGFQNPIDADRINVALSQACGDVRWESLGKRFDGDIVNGGCNFTTLAKMARADGYTTCTAYDTVSSAYDALTKFDLPQIKSVAVVVLANSMSIDQAQSKYCK